MIRERYEALRTIPGICTKGDLFIVYDSGEVDHVASLGPEAARRIKLHRRYLRPLRPVNAFDPDDSRPQIRRVR